MEMARLARRLLPALPVLLLAVAPLAAAPKKPAPAKPAAPAAAPVLKDRVMAVVADDPILASDLDRAIALGLQQPNAGEDPLAFRRRVLDALIAERLRFHEIDRFGFEQVPVDLIDKNVAEVRKRYKDEATFVKQLKEVGLSPEGLRQLVARQLMVTAYVDERLGPRVFVGLDDITKYYRTTLTPEMQKQHQPVPPLDTVREQIRNVLKQQRLTEELDRWTRELRTQANVAVYFDQPPTNLPPLVKRIDKPLNTRHRTRSTDIPALGAPLPPAAPPDMKAPPG